MSRKNFARNILAVLQAFIDCLVCRFSFWLVIALWLSGKTPGILTDDVQNFFTGTMLAVFCFNSLYSFRTWLVSDEIKTVLKSSFLILLITVLYLYSQRYDFSRFILASSIIIFIPLCVTARYIFRRVFFALGLLSNSIIVFGAGRTGGIFADKIASHPFTLGKIAGFLDDDPSKKGITVSGFKVLGKIDDFEKICAARNIDEAAVAISAASRSLLSHILDLAEFRVRHMHYIPDMYMLTAFSSSMLDVDGMPVASASQGLTNPVSRAVKSFADCVGSLAALVIFSPVMIWAAVKVKRCGGGKIFSRYERAGMGGKTFTMYKFRVSGMPDNGASLRSIYADELPQLFNVLRGEMSLVGPKALTGADLRHLYGGEAADKISMVKPGITGFWQISDRNGNDRKILREMDMYYIRNWSLWLDIVILLKTAFILIFRKRP